MPELDDRLSFESAERSAVNDSLGLARAAISLPLGDLSREEDTFEVEDREIVIFQLFGGVNGNDIVQ